MGDVPGCNSMTKTTSLCGGNPGSSSEKTSSYLQTVTPKIYPRIFIIILLYIPGMN